MGSDEREHRHTGSTSSADACGSIFNDNAAPGIDAKLGGGQVDFGMRLALLHRLGGQEHAWDRQARMLQAQDCRATGIGGANGPGR